MSQAELLAELINFDQIPPSVIWSEDSARFLQFSLNADITGLLSLDRLVEVIKIHPQEILPIPELPEYWLGIANRRGEAVWIVDLPYLIGDVHLSQRELVPEVCMAILIQAKDQAIGLLVEQVSSIEVYNLNNLQTFSSQTLSSKLRAFLEGYFIDSEGNTLALLDVDTIIEIVENSAQDF